MRTGISKWFCHPLMILLLSFVIPYFVASFIAGMLVLSGDDHPWQGISTEKERREIERHYEQEADRVGHQAGLKYGAIGLISALVVLGGSRVLRFYLRLPSHGN